MSESLLIGAKETDAGSFSNTPRFCILPPPHVKVTIWSVPG
jgi:hypothetical protein